MAYEPTVQKVSVTESETKIDVKLGENNWTEVTVTPTGVECDSSDPIDVYAIIDEAEDMLDNAL